VNTAAVILLVVAALQLVQLERVRRAVERTERAIKRRY
jgi:hypothetical protein